MNYLNRPDSDPHYPPTDGNTYDEDVNANSLRTSFSHSLPAMQHDGRAHYQKMHADTHMSNRLKRLFTRIVGWVNWLLQYAIFAVVAVITVLLSRLMPKTFNVRDSETGSTRAEHLRKYWRTYVQVNWSAIVRKGLYIVVVLVVVYYFTSYLNTRYNPEMRNRISRARSVTKYCAGHSDLMEVLKQKSLEVDDDAFASGVLPCGTRIEEIKQKLIRLYAEHNVDGHEHLCLTAKHLGHGYAIISKKNDAENTVDFIFNPTKFNPIKDDGVMKVNVTSDFFPLHDPIEKIRPMSAWILYQDSTGAQFRRKITEKTLHCIMEAWEILSDQHYKMFFTE